MRIRVEGRIEAIPTPTCHAISSLHEAFEAGVTGDEVHVEDTAAGVRLIRH